MLLGTADKRIISLQDRPIRRNVSPLLGNRNTQNRIRERANLRRLERRIKSRKNMRVVRVSSETQAVSELESRVHEDSFRRLVERRVPFRNNSLRQLTMEIHTFRQEKQLAQKNTYKKLTFR